MFGWMLVHGKNRHVGAGPPLPAALPTARPKLSWLCSPEHLEEATWSLTKLLRPVAYLVPGDAGAPTAELLNRTAKEVRNPLIAAAFRGIGLARQAGTGIRAIFRDWQGLGHGPPVIRSDEVRSEFELTLRGRGTLAGERRATVGTGAERVEDGDGDDRPVDPPRADMVSDHGDQVRADAGGDQAAHGLTARQRAILAACDVPRSLAELMERAGVSHRSHFRRKHLKPLLEAGLVRMTNPDKPRAPNQRYVLSEVGAALSRDQRQSSREREG